MNTQATNLSPEQEEALNNENIVFSPVIATADLQAAPNLQELEAQIDTTAAALSGDAPEAKTLEIEFTDRAKDVLFEFLPQMFPEGRTGTMNTDVVAFGEVDPIGSFANGAVEVNPIDGEGLVMYLPIAKRDETSILLDYVSPPSDEDEVRDGSTEVAAETAQVVVDEAVATEPLAIVVDHLDVQDAVIVAVAEEPVVADGNLDAQALNLYGDNVTYKPLPDIGESVSSAPPASVTEAEPVVDTAAAADPGALKKDSLEKIKGWGQQHSTKRDKSPRQQQAVLLAPAPSRTAEIIQKSLAKKVWTPQIDGKDHINVGGSAKTELGRMLQTKTLLPFMHPELGPFACIAGLMYYLQDPQSDQGFREWSEGQVLYRGRNIQLVTPPTFREVVAEALWIRTLQHPKLAKAMLENDLPFVGYRTELVGGQEVSRPILQIRWLIPVFEEIALTVKARAAMQDKELSNRTVPDFQWLVNERQAIEQSASRGRRRADRQQ